MENKPITVHEIMNYDPLIPNSVLMNTKMAGMDDFYPLKLFSTTAFCNAYFNEDYNCMLFMSVGVIINIIIRSKTATRIERLKLAHIGFFISIFYYSFLLTRNGKKFSPIFTVSICKHSANYFFAIINILSMISDSFPIDRIGSMICEHLFAKIRYESNGDNKILSFLDAFKRIIVISYFSQSSVIKKLSRRWIDSATIEEGESILNQEEVRNSCKFALTIFMKIGFNFDKKSAFFDLIENQNIDEFSEEFEKMMHLFRDKSINGNYTKRKGWELHITQASHKGGKNIIKRFTEAPYIE